MKTVSDLQVALSEQPNVGIAMTLNNAITSVIEQDGLTTEAELCFSLLGKIRAAVYAQAEAPKTHEEMVDDALLMLMAAFGGHSGNNVEESLRYIEGLMASYSITTQ